MCFKSNSNNLKLDKLLLSKLYKGASVSGMVVFLFLSQITASHMV